MPMQACILSQAALADWKARSIYRGDQWKIGRIKRKCNWLNCAVTSAG
jgi:hypothetical protein